MKKLFLIFPLFVGVSLGCVAQGCMAYLNDGVARLKGANGDIPTLIKLEAYFSDVDATCRDEIGNSAALYAAQVREMKSSIWAKERREELRRKEVARELAEKERKELERMRRDSITRIESNLVFIDGYGRLKDGSEYNIVQQITGKLASQGYEFADSLNAAVWAVYIAIDVRNSEYKPQRNVYVASVEPLIVIKNLVSGKVLYRGSGAEFDPKQQDPSKLPQDAEEGRHVEEMGAVRQAFRKTIPRLCPTIENFIKHE